MPNEPDFDLEAAHRYFAPRCFNRTWGLLDKADRTPDEDEEMLRLSHASLWHWTQRSDCTPVKLSIGYWQLSRVNSVLGRSDDATRYAECALAHADRPDTPPFFVAYAYEALARAAAVAGKKDAGRQYLSRAREFADRVEKDAEKQLLAADFASIERALE